MQPSSLLSVVSFLQLGAFTFAHSASDDFPVPKLFGSAAAMSRPAQHMIEAVQGYPASQGLQRRDWTVPDVDTNKKRCPGVGFCAPGDWLTGLINQVHYLEMAIRNILGFIPTYFRPPYDDCTSDICKSVLKRMGYHITYQNVVNNNWQNDEGSMIESTKESFVRAIHQTNPRDVDYIFSMHDAYYQTSWNLTNYMLNYLVFLNFSRSVTVGECIRDPPENWYRTAGGAANHTLLLHRSYSTTGSTVQYSTLLLICVELIAYMLL